MQRRQREPNGRSNKGGIMKKRAYITVGLLVLLSSIAMVAQAQTPGRTEIRATIPFEFNVGGAILPAGEYRIVSISDHSAYVTFRFERGTRAMVLVQLREVEGPVNQDPKLVFHRYGRTYFFAEACLNAGHGWQAPQSRAERAAEREMTQIQARMEAIEVRIR